MPIGKALQTWSGRITFPSEGTAAGFLASASLCNAGESTVDTTGTTATVYHKLFNPLLHFFLAIGWPLIHHRSPYDRNSVPFTCLARSGAPPSDKIMRLCPVQGELGAQGHTVHYCAASYEHCVPQCSTLWGSWGPLQIVQITVKLGRATTFPVISSTDLRRSIGIVGITFCFSSQGSAMSAGWHRNANRYSHTHTTTHTFHSQ